MKDNHINSVCSDLQNRAKLGFKKYGTTMDRADLTKTEWLQHAYEEALDLAVYLKKVITISERERESNICTHCDCCKTIKP